LPRGESVKLNMKDQTNTVMTMNTLSLTPRFSEVLQAGSALQPLQRFPFRSAQTDRVSRRFADGLASLVCAALCLLASPAPAATNDLTTALQRGLFEEEANQNLGAAIQAYQTVANQFDKDRKLAATAIFRLGECYRKQANTNDAAAQYERILRDFSDQPTLVTLSRQNLAALGSAPPTIATPAVSDAARQEQKRLLEEEIKVVQKQLEMQQAKYRGGIITYPEVLPTERDLLHLKRQVAALDAGLPVSITATEAAAPVPSDAARQEQKRLLEEEIKLVQKQLDALQKQVDANGVITPGDPVPMQRQILQLKRQMAALDAGLPLSFAAPETAPANSTEAEEVKRIETLIKDSPDLINAPDRQGVTLLQSAAAKGKLAVVKLLLESGAIVDGLQQPGLTPLHYAAANGHKAVVDLLLSKGAKADAQTQSGATPLHLAARKGYETVAKSLLAAGAPVNVQTKVASSSDTEDLQYRVSAGQTPLHVAGSAGYVGMVELLLAKGADPNAEDGPGRTPLSYVVENRYQAVTQVLLAAHANPNAGRLNLPLSTAAYQGDMAALKLLLANGADPNTNSTVNWSVNQRGAQFSQGGKFTPLFLAVSQRKAEAAKELLRCKANPNTSGPDGNPLLSEALSDAPTLKVLLEGSAEPNVRISDGTPLLLRAVWDKNQPAVELLLAHHAEVNCTVLGGSTPLQAAAAIGLKPIAELLLKSGAAVNAKDENGMTPLHEAVRHVYPELAELLLANNADPNAKDSKGWTPLHLAANDNQLEIVKLLLANKADPNERNNAGQTPLDLAKNLAQSAPGRPPVGLPVGYGYPVPAGTPVPMRLNPAPPLAYQWQAPGTPPAATAAKESKPETMADLLRRHGAADDLPRLDGIEARRGALRVNTPFTKGAHDWSQFTLLELIAVECEFLAGSPNDGEGDGHYSGPAFFNRFKVFPFPDFARLRVRRPAADLKSWKDQVVDFRPVLEAGDCSKDIRLEWGDVVDIPEADHPLNESWPGFSRTELANLKKCLTRQLEIVISGQATNMTLAPQISNVGEEREAVTAAAAANQEPIIARMLARRQEPSIVAHATFWLKPVLLQSKLVLTSSDLRRVKVTRRDTTSGQEHVWVVDCSQPNSSPDLWLRDGDKIEVPERTDSASAE
jgi:ankyrin repeat protein